MKKILISIALALGCIIVLFIAVVGNNFRKAMKMTAVQQHDKNLTILVGGGGNSIILTSDDGSQTLVVDTKTGGAAKKLAALVKPGDITIVNTHVHSDHTAGNPLFPEARIIAGTYTPEQWKKMAGKARFPHTTILPGDELVLQIGSETVRIRNMGVAHSWNDVVVYLENRRILLTGDIIFYKAHPGLFAAGGSNAALWTCTFDSLLAWYDPVMVIPGHGDITNRQALVETRDYFLDIKNALGDAAKIKAVKQKYKSYFGIPLMTGFGKTVAFMKHEQDKQ